MDIQAVAGIDIYGAALRYAEVQHRNGEYRLFRLGSCDFDFDVAHEMLHADEPQHLDIVAEALGDVFKGAASRHLRVAFHPLDGYAFTTTVPTELSEADRGQRIDREAALLIGTRTEGALHVTSQPVRTATLPDGETVDWLHVLALPEPVQTRFEHVFRALPHARYEWMLSTEGSTNVVQWIEQREATERPDEPFTLLIGWYDTHTEYALLQRGDWYFGHHAATGSETDCAYFSAALLDHLQIPLASVGRIYLYGKDIDLESFAPLQAVFGVTPLQLNPLAVVGVDPANLEGQVDPAVYAPCIGATL